MSTSKYVTAVMILIAATLFAASCNKGKTASAPSSTSTLTPMSANNPVPSPNSAPTGEIKGEPGKPQTVDILSGKPVVRSVYGDYDGERLYFCCNESKKMFEAKRTEYLRKIREKGIILEKTP